MQAVSIEELMNYNLRNFFHLSILLLKNINLNKINERILKTSFTNVSSYYTNENLLVKGRISDLILFKSSSSLICFSKCSINSIITFTNIHNVII